MESKEAPELIAQVLAVDAHLKNHAPCPITHFKINNERVGVCANHGARLTDKEPREGSRNCALNYCGRCGYHKIGHHTNMQGCATWNYYAEVI